MKTERIDDKLKAAWLKTLKIGDLVCRRFGYSEAVGGGAGGGIVMSIRVTNVTDKRIVCGAYEFDGETAGEINAEMGWDGKVTGSYIVPLPED